MVLTSAIMLLMAPAWAQSSTTEQDILQIRQQMARSFAEAVKNKDAVQAADQYSQDVVFSLLVPTQTVVVGKGSDTETLGGITQRGHSHRLYRYAERGAPDGGRRGVVYRDIRLPATDKDGSKRRVQGKTGSICCGVKLTADGG